MNQVPDCFIFPIPAAALLIVCTVVTSRGAMSDDWSFLVHLFEKDGVQGSFYITLAINEVMLVFAIGLCTIALALSFSLKTLAFLEVIFSFVLALLSVDEFISIENVYNAGIVDRKNIFALQCFSAICCIVALAQVGVSVWLLVCEQTLLRRTKVLFFFELFIITSLVVALTVTANLTLPFARNVSCNVTYLKIVLTYVAVHLFALAPLLATLIWEVPIGFKGNAEESSEPVYCKI